MLKFKKTISVLLATFILLGVLIASPISAGARVTFDPPSSEDIEDAVKERNIPTPKNLRCVATSEDSITVSWKYENWGYTLAYTTDSNEEPKWEGSYNTRTNDSKEDWKVTIDKLTPGKTYYIYVRHATIDVVQMYLTYLSGDYSMIKVKLKNNNTVSVKSVAKSLSVKSMKTAKKTVKPIKIKKAKGKIKVVKVKSGTSNSIFKKITVNKKNGAITFKKGNYKKGTYKVKLSITASGNKDYNEKTVTKVVKIKVK